MRSSLVILASFTFILSAHAKNCVVNFALEPDGNIQVQTSNPDIPEHFRKLNLNDDDGNMSYLILFKQLQNQHPKMLENSTTRLTQEQSNLLRAAAQRSLDHAQLIKTNLGLKEIGEAKEKLAQEILDALNNSPRTLGQEIIKKMASSLESDRENFVYNVTPENNAAEPFQYLFCREPLVARCPPFGPDCAQSKDYDYNNYLSEALCAHHFVSGNEEYESNKFAACPSYKIEVAEKRVVPTRGPRATGRPDRQR